MQLQAVQVKLINISKIKENIQNAYCTHIKNIYYTRTKQSANIVLTNSQTLKHKKCEGLLTRNIRIECSWGKKPST